MKKRVIFMLCALFTAITISSAQDNGDDKKATRENRRIEMAKKAAERLKSQLSLSDEQTAKVEELNKEYMPKMRKGTPDMRRHKKACPECGCDKAKCPKAKAKCKKSEKCCKETKKCDNAPKCNKPTQEQIEKQKAEMRETRKEYTEKLNKILTPEQQEKYKSLRKEGKGKKPGEKRQR